MNTKIIIMADGKGSRWEESRDFSPPVEYKQLLRVGDTPLLGRTIQQVKSHNFGNITIVCPDSFQRIPELQGVHTTTIGYRDHEERPLLDGILRTKSLWSERTIILLGDVCYSNYCIETILTEGMPYFLVGRYGENIYTGKKSPELFALIITEGLVKHFTNQALRILKQNNEYNLDSKLWDLYYSDNICLLLSIKDYTDDTDSPQAYMQFWDKLEKAAIDDDIKHR